MTQSDFWWVNTIGISNNVEYQLRGDMLVVVENIELQGQEIQVRFLSDSFQIVGRTISTASTTDNARDIAILAKHILIGGGTIIDARSTAVGKTSGKVGMIAAEYDKARITGGPIAAQANIDRLETSIDIGEAESMAGS